MIEVQAYQLSWHPEKGSAFRVKLVNQNSWTVWIKVSSADLAAIAAIMNEKPAFFDENTKSFGTGPEAVVD